MEPENTPTATEGTTGATSESKPKTTPASEPNKGLKRANDEARDRRLEVKSLRQQMTGLETQIAEMTTAFKAEQAARATAEANALAASRKAAAIKHGLPDKLAERLQGTTAEEIEADAAALAESLPKPAAGADGAAGAGANGGAKQPSPGNPAGHKGALTKAEIEKMTPTEYAARRDEIQAFLAGM